MGARWQLGLTGVDDGAVAGGTGVAIVSSKQVFDESVNSSVALAVHFKILVN